MRPKTNSKLKIVFRILGAMILILAILILIAILYVNNYKNPADQKLREAGIVEKNAQVGKVKFNYAEGPDNGPALLLLHAQLLDWYTYSSVLPELSKKFHVFAVDYPGHGKTTVADGYSMTANQIGSDLGNFIKDVIGKPAYVTGNSSGGLLTTWLAANRPELVKAIILEDPPLFSAEYPEIKRTIAMKAFITSHNAIQEGYPGNFLDYWIKNSAQFFRIYAGPLAQPLIEFAVNSYRSANPGQPVEIAFLPPSVQEVIRGLDHYDPHFGAAFYDGTWNAGFNHAGALQKIQCPALLLHANFEIEADGTLNGAMSQEQASRVAALLQQGQYLKVDSSHVINLEHPDEFIRIVENFLSSQK
jgi:pimeloyl-ACP methyl ester carboxylesterase